MDPNGSAILLARLYKLDSSQNLVPAVAADFQSITWSATSLHDGTPIGSYTNVNLTPLSVYVLAALSTGSVWALDQTGFNFLLVLPPGTFPGEPGTRITVTFVMADGVTTFFLRANAPVETVE